MGEVFKLKEGDTLPVLDVFLKNPDGSAHDLTGSNAYELRVLLNTGDVVIRDMIKIGADALGHLQYAWDDQDWNPANLNGFLIQGPNLPLEPGQEEHRMEYSVYSPGGGSLTFPNDDYDTLRILPRIE
jgi:hypothetical protein